LDEIHRILTEPLVDPEEISEALNRFFQEVSVGEEQTT
jgi:hypothetical protein